MKRIFLIFTVLLVTTFAAARGDSCDSCKAQCYQNSLGFYETCVEMYGDSANCYTLSNCLYNRCIVQNCSPCRVLAEDCPYSDE